MSVTLEQAAEIKTRHEQEWLEREGVTGVDVGMGSGGAVIRIYVRDTAGAADFPSQVEGVPVEVIARTFKLH